MTTVQGKNLTIEYTPVGKLQGCW